MPTKRDFRFKPKPEFERRHDWPRRPTAATRTPRVATNHTAEPPLYLEGDARSSSKPRWREGSEGANCHRFDAVTHAVRLGLPPARPCLAGELPTTQSTPLVPASHVVAEVLPKHAPRPTTPPKPANLNLAAVGRAGRRGAGSS